MCKYSIQPCIEVNCSCRCTLHVYSEVHGVFRYVIHLCIEVHYVDRCTMQVCSEVHICAYLLFMRALKYTG